VRQAEELCPCAGCRASLGLYERVWLARSAWSKPEAPPLADRVGPPKGRGFQGDNYYRPVTFSAPSLGDVPRRHGELRPLSCYAFAKRWLLPSPLGGETLERTALCSLSSS